MLINKTFLVSYAGNGYNKDIANCVHIKVNDSTYYTAAWVLDGDNGLGKEDGSKFDGKWLVKMLDRYLSKHIMNFDYTIHEILMEGMSEIEELYLSRSGNQQLAEVERPSTEIALFRWRKNKLEYYILGNCQLWIKDYKCIKEIADNNLSKINEKILDKVQRYQNKDVSYNEAVELAKKLKDEARYQCNKKNGYWLLNFNRIAIYHAVSGTIKYNEEYKSLELLLSTDGFNALSNTYSAMNEMDIFKYINKKKNLDEICFYLRSVEKNDEECNILFRLNRRDDASAVYIRLE